MATSQFAIAPKFLELIILRTLQGRQLALGIIPSGSEVSASLLSTNPASILSSELNTVGWSRPLLTVLGMGTLDTGNGNWKIPTLSWNVVAPTGGLNFKQCFAILDGAGTPRNTQGSIIGLVTYTNPAILRQGVSMPVSLTGILYDAS